MPIFFNDDGNIEPKISGYKSSKSEDEERNSLKLKKTLVKRLFTGKLNPKLALS